MQRAEKLLAHSELVWCLASIHRRIAMQNALSSLVNGAGSSERHALDLVSGVLASIEGVRGERIAPDAHLMEDVGLDSFQFVDVTVALERALGIAVFPMQEWVDETRAGGGPLTVAGLATACQRFLREIGT
jgi:acyl carrier protein